MQQHTVTGEQRAKNQSVDFLTGWHIHTQIQVDVLVFLFVLNWIQNYNKKIA